MAFPGHLFIMRNIAGPPVFKMAKPASPRECSAFEFLGNSYFGQCVDVGHYRPRSVDFRCRPSKIGPDQTERMPQGQGTDGSNRLRVGSLLRANVVQSSACSCLQMRPGSTRRGAIFSLPFSSRDVMRWCTLREAASSTTSRSSSERRSPGSTPFCSRRSSRASIQRV